MNVKSSCLFGFSTGKIKLKMKSSEELKNFPNHVLVRRTNYIIYYKQKLLEVHNFFLVKNSIYVKSFQPKTLIHKTTASFNLKKEEHSSKVFDFKVKQSSIDLKDLPGRKFHPKILNKINQSLIIFKERARTAAFKNTICSLNCRISWTS